MAQLVHCILVRAGAKGKDIGQVIATARPKVLVDIFGKADGIIDSITRKFREASDVPVRGLIDRVLRRSPDLINLKLLLETVVKLTGNILKAVITTAGKFAGHTGRHIQQQGQRGHP